MSINIEFVRLESNYVFDREHIDTCLSLHSLSSKTRLDLQ